MTRIASSLTRDQCRCTSSRVCAFGTSNVPGCGTSGRWVSRHPSRTAYVVEHPDGAGTSVVMIFLDDLDAQKAAIAGRGLQPDERELYTNGVRKVIYRDPDGNELGFGGAPLQTGS